MLVFGKVSNKPDFLVNLDFRYSVYCSSSKKSTELTKDAPIKELVNSDAKKCWNYGIIVSSQLWTIASKNVKKSW